MDYANLEERKLLAALFPAYADGTFTLGDETSSAPYELSDTFKLESNPSSNKTIYLDFNGHYSSGNAWNHSLNFPAYNTAGSHSSFSTSELREIQKIFQNVAEDFLPLDVNVTTQNPGVAALTKSTGSDQSYGIRVVVSQHVGSFASGYGGYAKFNTFMDRRDTPVFSFNKGVNDASWITSHEIGHSLGLSHDGHFGTTYHPGSGSGETSWGPIMGGAFGKSLTQWSRGEYAGSNNGQDDLQVMTRGATGVDMRADDVGNSFASSDGLSRRGEHVFDWGIINNRNDVDVYRFTSGNADLSLSINPLQPYGNLDIHAKLYSANGTLLSSSNPSNLEGANIDRELEPGTYYLSIDGVGKAGVYSDYGSLGFYSIEGSITPEIVPLTEIGESGSVQYIDNHWRTVNLTGNYLDPVVIAGPASLNDPTQSVVRVRNVQSNSFEMKIDNWDYLGQLHGQERVSYMVVESGRHQLADGTVMVAGNGWINQRYRRIGFGAHFDNEPVVFAQVVSAREDSAVTARVSRITTGAFGIRLQEEEANNGVHLVEQFSYLAIEQVDSEINGLLVETDSAMVSNSPRTIDFANRYPSLPVFLANMQTRNGDDTATIRVHSQDRDSARVFVEEGKIWRQ